MTNAEKSAVAAVKRMDEFAQAAAPAEIEIPGNKVDLETKLFKASALAHALDKLLMDGDLNNAQFISEMLCEHIDSI